MRTFGGLLVLSSWLCLASGHSRYNMYIIHMDNQKQIQKLCDMSLLTLTDIWKEARLKKLTPYSIIKDASIMDTMNQQPQFKSRCDVEVPTCDSSAPYRTADGSCNNLNHPTWGMAKMPQVRYLPAVYDDGFDLPRTLSPDRSRKLPNARFVSNTVHRPGPFSEENPTLSAWVMQWGQFLDHDVVLTPVTEGTMGGGKIECCNGDGCLSECFPIKIPEGDPFYNRTCMNFVRSAPAMDFFDCKHGIRQQMNGITSYIDGSAVYGSGQKDQDMLRLHIGGLLRTSPSQNLPQNPDDSVCKKDVPTDFCMKAGDPRSNVVPSLGTSHTLFLREHNRIAKSLADINPGWDDEKIFQEARKIVGAIMQHITYQEYLPVVLGARHMDSYGLTLSPSGFSNTYDPSINAGTSNAFGACFFRFGHSQVSNKQGARNPDYSDSDIRNIEDTYHRPNMVLSDKGADGITRWLATDASLKTDRILDSGLRDLLFRTADGISLDLAALNIQRGRDHGLPPYNEWRKLCGLAPVERFGTSPGGLVDHTDEVASLLEEAYEDPADIDIFTGGLSEKNVPGGDVGPTFACMLAKQFEAYKKGDRFWYELDNSLTGFTEDQLNEIRKVSLARVICDNTDTTNIARQAMLLPGPSNKMKKCKKIAEMDLNLWAE